MKIGLVMIFLGIVSWGFVAWSHHENSETFLISGVILMCLFGWTAGKLNYLERKVKEG